MEKTKEELVRELMYLGFASAAGAFRLYPDNKHTFADHSDYLMEKGLKIFDQFKDESGEQDELKKENERLREALKKISQMSDSGSSLSAMIDMKRIASEALSPRSDH